MGWFIINVLKLQACSRLLLNYGHKSRSSSGSRAGQVEVFIISGGKLLPAQGSSCTQPKGWLWHPWVQEA